MGLEWDHDGEEKGHFQVFTPKKEHQMEQKIENRCKVGLYDMVMYRDQGFQKLRPTVWESLQQKDAHTFGFRFETKS